MTMNSNEQYPEWRIGVGELHAAQVERHSKLLWLYNEVLHMTHLAKKELSLTTIDELEDMVREQREIAIENHERFIDVLRAIAYDPNKTKAFRIGLKNLFVDKLPEHEGEQPTDG